MVKYGQITLLSEQGMPTNQSMSLEQDVVFGSYAFFCAFLAPLRFSFFQCVLKIN
jgi:hypothetical protein